jgi:choline kinase
MISLAILAAGISSRFNGKPKSLEKVGLNNETLIEVSLQQALKSPFTKIIIITNHNLKEQFESVLGNEYMNIPIKYLFQTYDTNIRTKPFGTTDAICVLKDEVKEPVIIINGDDLYGEQAFKDGFNLIQNNNIMGVVKMSDCIPNEGYVNRGLVTIDDKFITDIVELLKINKSYDSTNKYANVNFIGLHPNTINLLYDELILYKDKFYHDNSKECMITDSLGYLIKNNKITIKSFLIQNKIIGITNPGDEINIKKYIQSFNK